MSCNLIQLVVNHLSRSEFAFIIRKEISRYPDLDPSLLRWMDRALLPFMANRSYNLNHKKEEITRKCHKIS